MKGESLTIRLGESVKNVDGVSIVVSAEKKQNMNVSDTARHEAAHVVVAGQIHSATIIPSTDYLGATMPTHMTAEAAMAADALGMDGTGWDVHLTKNILGSNPESAAGRARSILSQRQEEMQMVAEQLDEHGTIDQSHVDAAFQAASDRRRGNVAANIVIRHEDGRENRFRAKAQGFRVLVPGEWVNPEENKANVPVRPPERQNDRRRPIAA